MKVTATFSLLLPPGSQIKVKEGTEVSAGDVLANVSDITPIKEYNMAQILDVSPGKVVDCFVKRIGEKINPGEVIAERKGFLGKAKELVCDTQGLLGSLSEDGTLSIIKDVPPRAIKTHFSGKITKIDEKKLVMTFPALEIKGVWGVGGQGFGQLSLLDNEDLGCLSDGVKGKVIAIRGGFSMGFWYKAITLGITGLISGGFDEAFKLEIERESIPLVALSDEKINENLWQTLTENKNKEVLIDGKEEKLFIPL